VIKREKMADFQKFAMYRVTRIFNVIIGLFIRISHKY